MTTAYYNEFEPFAANWLGNLASKGLIADGTIDRRSIADVSPDDVSGFRRVHFFAGIGGWDYALQLAGWPADRPVWTGSCPCQPYSSAGKQLGNADARNLWPEIFRLVAACRPECVFGEQVPAAIGHGWLDGVFADLEGIGYACGAVVLGAHSVRAPHIRQRLYWVAYDNGQRFSRRPQPDGVAIESEQQSPRRPDAGGRGDPGRLEHTTSDGRIARRPEPVGRSIAGGCGDGGLGNAASDDQLGDRIGVESGRRAGEARRSGDGDHVVRLGHADGEGQRGQRPEIRRAPEAGRASGDDAWSDFRLVPCADGKTRRVGTRVQPLAYGIPRNLGRGKPELRRLARSASGNRVGRLRGYGNAIVPQVAAVFIRAFMEATS